MFRLYTEDINRAAIYNVVGSFVEGWTAYTASGAWKGTEENSLVIELFDATKTQATEIAAEIARVNKQQTVAVVELPATVEFVTAALTERIAA